MTGARGSPGKRVNISFRFAVYTFPNATFITIFTIFCSCGTTVRPRGQYFLYRTVSTSSREQHETLVLSNELIKAELPS